MAHAAASTESQQPPHTHPQPSWDSVADAIQAHQLPTLDKVRTARSEQIGSEISGWEYRPHASGDPIDAAVATLVNRPGRYRGWRALLCRLEQGIYLCGTRRVHLRADVGQEKIEASDDGGTTWSDLEVLMKGAEASQRALLERARDAAGLTA
jgi:hypothetical protein